MTSLIEFRLKRKLTKLLKQPSFYFIQKLNHHFPQSTIYLVGGAVRDLLLNRPTKDFDFVVQNIPVEKLEEFLRSLGLVNLVGKTFGVFKFIPQLSSRRKASTQEKLEPFDIALPRTEHAWGSGAYRDVAVQMSPKLPIETDLQRRDFTINAIACQLNQQFKLIDPGNGLVDLRKKIIKTVGKPAERFKEDYTRLLRAIRLACQLNFQIEKDTWYLMKKYVPHLNDLNSRQERIAPFEIIAKEWLAAFAADPPRALELFDKSGILKEFTPELLEMKNCPQPPQFHTEGDVWQHTVLALKLMKTKSFKREFPDIFTSSNTTYPPLLVMAVLFHDIGKPTTLKTPEQHGVERIRTDEHDIKGSEITRQICSRLRLAAPAEIGIDCEKLSWLVKHHLLLIHGSIDKMKAATIEKYFFNNQVPGATLLQLTFLDALATKPADGSSTLINYYQMKKRIKDLKKLDSRKRDLPPPLLDGYEIMKILKSPPGPQIGLLKNELREKQLSKEIKTKEEAISFLKNKQLGKK